MRRGLFLLLLVVLIGSCLPRSTGLEQPTVKETPQGDGNSNKVVGNPLVITEDPCGLSAQCEPQVLPPSPKETENTPDTSNQTSTGGNTPLVIDTPELTDDTRLDAVKLSAECMHCLHPLGSYEVELRCEVRGCSDGFNFVTSTNRPRSSYRQALCGGSGKTASDLMSLKLVCQFTQKKRFWPDYKKATELRLSKSIVKAQSLCVVTADSLVPSGSDIVAEETLRPEPKIERSNCNHSSMWIKKQKHKLSLSFSW